MLDVKNLSVKYDTSDEYALKDINFTIGSKEHVALIGANGAGKSTLLLSLCGVIPPLSGEILIDEFLLCKKNLKEARRRIGMVFQNPDDQLFMPTVYEDTAFAPRNYGFSENEIEKKADEIFEKLGITKLKNRMSHKLSGGEKRLAALAGVLIVEPSMLFMDEPSSFLDPRSRRILIDILKNLPQMILFATHDLDMALDLCQRVILLKNGTVYKDADAKEILFDKALLEECGLELPLIVKSH